MGWCTDLLALKEIPEQSRSVAASVRTTVRAGRGRCEGERGAEGKARSPGEYVKEKRGTDRSGPFAFQ